jgi:hypothetical protein
MKINELIEHMDLISKELAYQGALKGDPDVIQGFQRDWEEINVAYSFIKEYLSYEIQQTVECQLQELKLQLELEMKLAKGETYFLEWEALEEFYCEMEESQNKVKKG